MHQLNNCDVCGKPGRWGMFVTGCSEHKVALKAAVENCNNNQKLQDQIASIVAAYDCDSVTADYLVYQLRQLLVAETK